MPHWAYYRATLNLLSAKISDANTIIAMHMELVWDFEYRRYQRGCNYTISLPLDSSLYFHSLMNCTWEPISNISLPSSCPSSWTMPFYNVRLLDMAHSDSFATLPMMRLKWHCTVIKFFALPHCPIVVGTMISLVAWVSYRQFAFPHCMDSEKIYCTLPEFCYISSVFYCWRY